MDKPKNLEQWLDHLEHRHPTEIDLGLERVQAVWQKLGSPNPAPVCITVAGTNGKGSTIAWLAALAASKGLKTAAYTSPHLLQFTERLRIGGLELGQAEWVGALDQVEQARAGVGLSYFEHTTLAAFLLMAEAELDWALLEVGLGGRLDAVNIIDAEVAIITPIDLDHQQWLGNSREEIAREKGGILRAGQHLVLSDSNPPDSLVEMAARLDVRIHRIGHCFGPIEAAHVLRVHGQAVEWPAELPVAGPHQFDNLSAAMMVECLLTGEVRETPDWATVFQHLHLPGRLQTVETEPHVVVDVGHNPQAASSLVAALGSLGHDWHIVLGMLADKDAAAYIVAVEPLAGAWHLCALPGSRGQSAKALLKASGLAESEQSIQLHDSVPAGLEVAKRAAGKTGRVLIAGSFVTAAAALESVAGH